MEETLENMTWQIVIDKADVPGLATSKMNRGGVQRGEI
jgi:hypothetical protein